MNIMDHEQAVKMQAAERYLLDELSGEERDDFEEHYFTCQSCAEEVRTVFAFTDNARHVFAEQAAAAAAIPLAVEPPAGRDWFAWLHMSWAPVAAALLLGVTLYQSLLVIPSLNRQLSEVNEAQLVPTIVARSVTRGEDAVVVVEDNAPFVHLVLDMNVAPSVSSYVCEVRDGAGSLLFTVDVPSPRAGASLNLLLPAAKLATGRHTVSIRPVVPDSGVELQEYSFLVQRQ